MMHHGAMAKHGGAKHPLAEHHKGATHMVTNTKTTKTSEMAHDDAMTAAPK